MADITPLRGEGRTVGRITGIYGELLSEFLGTFVLIAFGDGVVAMAVAAQPRARRPPGPPPLLPTGCGPPGAGPWPARAASGGRAG